MVQNTGGAVGKVSTIPALLEIGVPSFGAAGTLVVKAHLLQSYAAMSLLGRVSLVTFTQNTWGLLRVLSLT